MSTTAGYGHRAYAESLSEFGTPLQLRESGGCLLARDIPGTELQDAMGSYPLFACHNWRGLPADFEQLENLVSLSVVLDPFGDFDIDSARAWFHDVVIPMKQHFVIDLTQRMDSYISSHHRRYARKALRNLEVTQCPAPLDALDDWNTLYANLIRKHEIHGIRAFSTLAFAKQLAVPGIVAFRATLEGDAVGMLLWYVQGEYAYYHLGASSDVGYRNKASFGMFWRAIEYFSENGVKWVTLGGDVGASGGDGGGLGAFKSGWSTGSREAFFCGRILDHDAYERLARANGTLGNPYFPAYRAGEFT